MSSMSPHADRRFNIEGRELGYPTLFQDGSTSVGMFIVPSKVANGIFSDSIGIMSPVTIKSSQMPDNEAQGKIIESAQLLVMSDQSLKRGR